MVIAQLRKCPATWQLIRILVIIHIIPVLWTHFGTIDKVHQSHLLFGLNWNQFLRGKYWQALSYTIIHANWLHLFLNAAIILIFGSKLENIITKRSFWLLGLYSTLCGGLLFLVFDFLASGPPKTLVGASAICMGFIVFYTTLSPQSRFLPLFFNGKLLGLAIILASLVLALLDPALPYSPVKTLVPTDSAIFQVSHACHLGGALCGWLYGRFTLRPRVSLQSLQKARAKSEKLRNLLF